MNPIITVDGDQATADWLLFQPCTTPGEEGERDQALWLAATYHDQYRRVEGHVDDFGDGDRRRVLHTLRHWLGEATILARTRTVTPPPLVVRRLPRVRLMTRHMRHGT